MGGVILIVALIGAAILTGFLGFLIALRLRREVEALQARVALLERAQDQSPEFKTAPKAAPVQAEAAKSAAEVSAPPAPASQGPSDPPKTRPAQSVKRKPPAPKTPNTPAFVSTLLEWVAGQWFYVVSGVSLCLAGIFLVQYGVEAGLITPLMRVLMAGAFGCALVYAGEFIRRRFGDRAEQATAHIPAVFSGAGLVVLFGAIIAARGLYDLLTPASALALLVLCALGGLVLGWRHGPFLAALSLIGAYAAPFLVGGQSAQPEWFFVYFALITALGLGIDTLRRWAWVSVLAVAGGFGAAGVLAIGAGTDSVLAAFMGFAMVAFALAVLVPCRALWPDHAEPMLCMLTKHSARPSFPVMLSAGALLATCLTLFAVPLLTVTLYWAALAGLAGLSAALILWSRGAPGLSDLTALPLGTALVLLIAPGPVRVMIQGLEARAINFATQTEAPALIVFTAALGIATALGIMAALRARGDKYALAWSALAVLIAPATGLALEHFWSPADFIGRFAWALHALAVAAVMVLKAERFAAEDAPDKARPALAVIAALACVSFALGLILSGAALTLALAITVLVAAALDWRFDLPWVRFFAFAGSAGVLYRLVADPGFYWADRAPWGEMALAYGGATLAFWGASKLIRNRQAQQICETAAWVALTFFGTFSLIQFLRDGLGLTIPMYLNFGLLGFLWCVLAMAYYTRAAQWGGLWPRIVAAMAGASALLFVFAASGTAPIWVSEAVLGWPVLNSLALAYLPVALVLLVFARRGPNTIVQRTLIGFAALLIGFWAFLCIRHLWQGAGGMPLRHGFMEGELYSYTAALLGLGGALFYQALAKGAPVLRRLGNVVTLMAVGKVFLVDMSGLDGLWRVFAFLLLGLALAGLAWFNRWAGARSGA